VHSVLLTHEHYDHASGGKEMQRRGMKLYAHKKAAEAIAVGDLRTAIHFFHTEFTATKVDYILEENGVLNLKDFKIEFFHIPGHSHGSIAYRIELDNRKLLFTGDTIRSHPLTGWSGGIDYDRDQYIASLKFLCGIEADVLLPGHGLVCFRNPHIWIEASLEELLRAKQGFYPENL
jgi:glyoxylase-like metal-dependent hydrolase (beta-lactamase superfamily II)